MQVRKVRQRINPTYTQTFYFSDPAPAKEIQRCQVNSCDKYESCQNVIEHPITRQQTKEQILHKTVLGIKNEQKQIPSYIICTRDNKYAEEMKLRQMKGQLEEGGVQFFLKEYPYDNKMKKQDHLIPSDCSFRHTCYGKVGLMNEFCNHNKASFDRFLKNQYDFKHHSNECLCSDKKFVFREKNKTKKNQK